MTMIAELAEDAYSAAVKAAVDTVRAKHPDLDLRSGTAVRALVVEPGALLDASQRDTVNRLRTAMSLRAMARETTVPREDAEAVLSNFGIELGGGTKATGFVRVNLVGTAPVTVRAGVVFTAEDGIRFVVTKTTAAAVDPAEGEEEIRLATGGRYYFTVPVEAEEVGASGNIRQGRALECSIIIGNYYSSEAFSDFTGGEDGESVASAVAREFGLPVLEIGAEVEKIEKGDDVEVDLKTGEMHTTRAKNDYLQIRGENKASTDALYMAGLAVGDVYLP